MSDSKRLLTAVHRWTAAAVASALALACGSDADYSNPEAVTAGAPSSAQGSGGEPALSGGTSGAGTPSGGSIAGSATGGSTSEVGGASSGGSGAVEATGGAPSTGGATGSGGSGALAATGGAESIGGNVSTGGSLSTGGVAESGGTGGFIATGGFENTGGAEDTGGAVGTAGATAAGGTGEGGAGNETPQGQCVVQPLTDEFRQDYDNLDPFYQKYADANGLPVISSLSPADEALERACELVIDMVSTRPDVLQALIANRIRFAIIGEDELTNDIPEYSYLPDSINDRARGLGGMPAASCAEESILCNTALDRWRGEGICVHEFAHTISMGGLFPADPTFEGRLEDAYASAQAAGLFANTYAMENSQEYWAEGVQDWYNTNLEATRRTTVRGLLRRLALTVAVARLRPGGPCRHGLAAPAARLRDLPASFTGRPRACTISQSPRARERYFMHPIRKVLGTICDHCPLCNYARQHPDTLMGKYYAWHGKWCPAWQAQQEMEAARKAQAAKQEVAEGESAEPD
jgi:hypothetical protein